MLVLDVVLPKTDFDTPMSSYIWPRQLVYHNHSTAPAPATSRYRSRPRLCTPPQHPAPLRAPKPIMWHQVLDWLIQRAAACPKLVSLTQPVECLSRLVVDTGGLVRCPIQDWIEGADGRKANRQKPNPLQYTVRMSDDALSMNSRVLRCCIGYVLDGQSDKRL